jgi:hypothetical protein
MFISAPGRPRTTSSLKSPRGQGVKVVAQKTGSSSASSSRPGSHSFGHKHPAGSGGGGADRLAPWSASAADQFAPQLHLHHQPQGAEEPLQDLGIAILKTEVLHFGR